MSIYVTRIEICKACGFTDVASYKRTGSGSRYHVSVDEDDDEQIKRQIREIQGDSKGCGCGAPPEIRLHDSSSSRLDGTRYLRMDGFNRLLFDPPWSLEAADKHIYAVECADCGRRHLITDGEWFSEYRCFVLADGGEVRDGDELKQACGAGLCQGRLRMRLAVIDWETARWLMMNYQKPFVPVRLHPDRMVGLDKHQARWASMYAGAAQRAYLLDSLEFGAPTGEPAIDVEKW